MSEIRKLVGNRIRELRKEQGLSQDQLGEKAGFHFSYVGKIERGEKNISIDNLEKLANALDVKINQLFGYFELEQLTEKDKVAKEILELLMKQTEHDLRRANNILKEIF